MEFLKYFFRPNEDGFVFPKYGLIHICLIIVFFLVAYIIVTKKFGLDNKRKNRKLLITFASIILVDQIILYSWLIGTGIFSVESHLPLYHCRLSVYFLILGIFTNNKFLKVMTIFWGSLGALMALMIPDLYAYSFPHYTNFQFFLVHFILGWVVLDFIFVENIEISLKDLKAVLLISNLFNLVILGLNLVLLKWYPNVNYSYLIGLPGGKALFGSRLTHLVLYIFAFNCVCLAIYRILNLRNEKVAYEEKTNF